ncbi:hypothetical protein CspHIS471_0107940 [Cutaneotrichosporon sp. HIS471]|nr:hypothetical protein CspHIS471_0107940 [Cutaneotrichosporon sp. HIS471]
MDALDTHTQHQHQDHGSDESALAAAQAAQAAAIHLDLNALQAESHQHDFEHHLQQSDFGHTKNDGTTHTDVDVHGLEIPVEGQDEMSLAVNDQLTLALEQHSHAHTPHHVDTQRASPYNRPPSIRKACDLCHQAKQKCSGDRPSCTRCAQGGWSCVYAPRQRRRTVPKDQKQNLNLDARGGNPYGMLGKKRKLQRDGLSIADPMDMRLAMGMALDLSLDQDDEDEGLLSLNEDQMIDSIAVDGYLDDLPLQTFVNNLPYNQPQSTSTTFTSSDFPDANDASYSSEMDQHTTSALRDAIFSLNESSNAGGQNDGPVDGPDGTDQQGMESLDGQGLDPHLALLDLSHAMPVEDGNNTGTDGTGELNLGSLGAQYGSGCPHVSLVPRILALLHQHPLEPKPGSNTPLSMYVFAPLSRALRLFHSIVQCQQCVTSPSQTLPQLALLSRTTTILTYPVPPPPPNAAGQPSAQITVHGARLAMTGISEAIEQHIVGVIWDSWRASVREIFQAFERKAQEVIQQNAQLAAEQGGQPPPSSAETQRAGLMFQAMSRLVCAMNDVERD